MDASCWRRASKTRNDYNDIGKQISKSINYECHVLITHMLCAAPDQETEPMNLFKAVVFLEQSVHNQQTVSNCFVLKKICIGKNRAFSQCVNLLLVTHYHSVPYKSTTTFYSTQGSSSATKAAAILTSKGRKEWGGGHVNSVMYEQLHWVELWTDTVKRNTFKKHKRNETEQNSTEEALACKDQCLCLT